MRVGGRCAWFIVLVLLATRAPGAAAAGKGIQGAVNLNTAPPEVLGLLPGVGPAKAQSILAYRKKHPFRTVDELVRIKGIGRKMVRGLRAHLAVGGPSTATAAAAAAPPPAPPPPVVRRPPILASARPPIRPARPPRPGSWPRATHGSCPPPP